MRYSISDTAEYGDYCHGQAHHHGRDAKKEMKKVLGEIQNGEPLQASGYWKTMANRPGLQCADASMEKEHPAETFCAELRSKMSGQKN